MVLGMPTLIENRNLHENVKMCAGLGLQFVELNMNLPMFQLEQIGKTGSLRELARKYKIFYTIHLEENLNVGDFNSGVAQAYLDTVSSTIQIAANLGAPIINMHLHPGVYFTMPGKRVYLFERYREWYMAKMLRFREMCEREIGNYPLRIAVENTDGFLPFQREALQLLLESHVFALTWDIGHSHTAGGADENWILEHADRLAHFHMHDALQKENHLALGAGEIELRQRFETARRHSCTCVLETKSIAALEESVRWVRSNIAEAF